MEYYAYFLLAVVSGSIFIMGYYMYKDNLSLN